MLCDSMLVKNCEYKKKIMSEIKTKELTLYNKALFQLSVICLSLSFFTYIYRRCALHIYSL
jgi:hypothetical protein